MCFCFIKKPVIICILFFACIIGGSPAGGSPARGSPAGSVAGSAAASPANSVAGSPGASPENSVVGTNTDVKVEAVSGSAGVSPGASPGASPENSVVGSSTDVKVEAVASTKTEEAEVDYFADDSNDAPPAEVAAPELEAVIPAFSSSPSADEKEKKTETEAATESSAAAAGTDEGLVPVISAEDDIAPEIKLKDVPSDDVLEAKQDDKKEEKQGEEHEGLLEAQYRKCCPNGCLSGYHWKATNETSWSLTTKRLVAGFNDRQTKKIFKEYDTDDSG